MRMSRNIVIGGGTGFVGKHLINALKNKNYNITVISRMPGPQHISWNDLNKSGLPQGTVAVVNLAGQNVMDFKQRWSAGFKQNVFNSRVNTTSALARAINEIQVKPEVFISMSGVGAYKPDKTVQYTESSKVSNFDFFSKLVLEWEKATCLNTKAESQCRVISIRSGVVLGRDGGMIKQLYLPFFLGLGGPVGDGSQFLPWIHITDLVNLIIFSIENKVKGIINGVAPNPCTNKEFSNAFAKALKRPAYIPVPKLVFNIMLGSERAKMITEGQKVLPQRAQELGFKFQYPTVSEACLNIVKYK